MSRNCKTCDTSTWMEIKLGYFQLKIDRLDNMNVCKQIKKPLG